MFKPTYLYIKIHRITGKKYFGKTTLNPMNYTGSGVYWKRHLKKHGNLVDTHILGLFDDEIQCILYAYAYSELNNIVDSAEWLNLKVENGLDGGWDHVNQNDVFSKNSNAGKKAHALHPHLKKNIGFGSRIKSAQTIKARYGDVFFKKLGTSYERTSEIRKKWSDAQKGMKMINNGIKNTYVKQEILEMYLNSGWVLGRLKK